MVHTCIPSNNEMRGEDEFPARACELACVGYLVRLQARGRSCLIYKKIEVT